MTTFREPGQASAARLADDVIKTVLAGGRWRALPAKEAKRVLKRVAAHAPSAQSSSLHILETRYELADGAYRILEPVGGGAEPVVEKLVPAG